MTAKINILGEVFGRLRVVEDYGHDCSGRALWNCLCSCGKSCVVLSRNLRIGHTKSCGCLNDETRLKNTTKHGKYYTGVYGRWAGILQRCNNKKNIHYKDYGGRGITVCPAWLKFENFYKDMGDPPSDEYQIDRIDNDKGYFKANCRWSLPKENSRNRRTNTLLTYKEKTQCVRAWEEELGFSPGTLWTRIYKYRRGIEEAFETPPGRLNRKNTRLIDRRI